MSSTYTIALLFAIIISYSQAASILTYFNSSDCSTAPTSGAFLPTGK